MIICGRCSALRMPIIHTPRNTGYGIIGEARETIARCVAGALAKLVLTRLGIEVWAYTSQVGELSLSGDYNRYDFDEIEKNPVRCPDADMAKRMEEYIG